MKLRLVFPGRSRAVRPAGRGHHVGEALLWIVGGGGLALVVFGLSFYLALIAEMRSTEVHVPPLVGMTIEQATSTVQPFGLVLDVVDQRNDPAVPSGHVLQQMPPAESAVRRGRKIKLVLSLGGRVLEVPDLVGHAARAVEIELRQEGFATGDEARIASADVPSGRIIAQVPPPGTPAVPGTRVHRLVSTGPSVAAWVMPDLTGLTEDQAGRWIGSSQFRRGAVRRIRVSGRRGGTVIGQLPLAGYPVRDRDVVELTVAQ